MSYMPVPRRLTCTAPPEQLNVRDRNGLALVNVVGKPAARPSTVA